MIRRLIILFVLLIFGCKGVYTPEDCAGEIDKNVELWGECYNIANTTRLYRSPEENVEDGMVYTIPSLTGEIPPEIGKLTNLISLDLWGNQLTGSIPPEIGNLTNLTMLWLGDNQLTGEIPSEIGNLTNLNSLTLERNQLSGEIPQEVCDLIESNNLETISILNLNNLINTCE